LTTYYDDKILEKTKEWIGTNALVWAVKGDKTGTIKAIHELESMKYLESRRIRNSIQYRRKDTTVTNENFNNIIELFQMNQDTEFDEIEKITRLTKKSGKLSKRATDLLWHMEFMSTKIKQSLAELDCEETIINDKLRFGRARKSMMNVLRAKYTDEIANRALGRVNKRMQHGHLNS